MHQPEMGMIGTMMRRGNLVDPLRVLDQQHQIVIVDVPGRNSQELLSAAIVADVLIAPHACSQLDLETLQELEEQVQHVRQMNPRLRVLIYQAIATTNPALRKRERADFKDYVSAFEGFELARSIGFQRLVYRECISAGTGVVETANLQAANEISDLVCEVLHGYVSTRALAAPIYDTSVYFPNPKAALPVRQADGILDLVTRWSPQRTTGPPPYSVHSGSCSP